MPIGQREFLPRGDRFGDIIILSPRFEFDHCPSPSKFSGIVSLSTTKDQLNDQTILIIGQGQMTIQWLNSVHLCSPDGMQEIVLTSLRFTRKKLSVAIFPRCQSLNHVCP